MTSALEYRILGPLEIWRNGGRIAIAAPRQRALLGFLLIHSNEVVPQETLIEQLWGEEPPATARASLHNHVHALRALLGAGVLERQPAGYVLHVERGQLDLERFERLAADARRAEPTERAAMLRDALACWRGPPLVEFPTEPFAQHEINRLEEERLSALEDRIDADLELGRHSDLVAELQALVDDYPLRERLWAQLMLALYRAGRQADALATYRRAHEAFVGDLGIEPGVVLRELQRAILVQDSALDDPGGRVGSTLERAAAILPRDPGARAESLYEYGVSLLQLGDHRQAETTLAAAERLAAATGELSIEERARLYRSYLSMWTEGTSSPVHLERAESASRRFAERGDDAGLAIALRHRSQLMAWSGRAEEGTTLISRAIELAIRGGDVRKEASLRAVLPDFFAMGPMPVEEAIGRCEEQLAPELRRESRPRIPILSALVVLHAQAGRIEVARRLGEEAIEAARASGLVMHLLGAFWVCGIAEFTTRNLEQAIDHMRSAFQMRETEDDHSLRPAIAAELACMLAFDGDLTEAARLAATARRNDGPDVPDFATGVFWRRALARVAASDGRPDEALRLADEARTRTAASDWLTFHGETLEDVASVHEQAGDGLEASAALTEAFEVYERKGNVVGAERVRGRLAGPRG